MAGSLWMAVLPYFAPGIRWAHLDTLVTPAAYGSQPQESRRVRSQSSGPGRGHTRAGLDALPQPGGNQRRAGAARLDREVL